jgi:hypothetical protein
MKETQSNVIYVFISICSGGDGYGRHHNSTIYRER